MKIYSQVKCCIVTMILFITTTAVVFANITANFPDILVGALPTGIVMAPNQNQAYVTNIADNSISVINIISRSVTNTISFDHDYASHFLGGPIAVSPDNSTLYASASRLHMPFSTVIRVIDISSTMHTDIALNDSTYIDGLTLSADGTKLYAVGVDYGSEKSYLYSIDTKTKAVLEKPLVCPGLTQNFRGGLATLSPDAKTLYVLCNTDFGSQLQQAELLAIDTDSLQVRNYTQISNNHITGLALSANGSTVYTASSLADKKTILTINTTTMQVSGQMTTDSDAVALALSIDGTQLFASEPNKKQIEALDITSGLSRGTVAVDAQPHNLAVTLDNKALYMVIPNENAIKIMNFYILN